MPSHQSQQLQRLCSPWGGCDTDGGCNMILAVDRYAVCKSCPGHLSTPPAACMCRDGAAASNLYILRLPVARKCSVGGAPVCH